MKASVVLTPVAAKRLIAKGIKALPVVKKALADHTLVITLGTTNGIVAEELLGKEIDKEAFAAGFIDGRFNVNKRLGEMDEVIIRKGKEVKLNQLEIINSLTTGDVLIKGGNAIDPWGHVGVLMSSRQAGTVGRYYSIALARGVDIVIPVSLQKAIHSSIEDLARQMGTDRIDLSMGHACGMHPITGRVVTEIDALEELFEVQVTQIASGGTGSGAGSVSLLITGQEKPVRGAFELVTSLSDEKEISLEGQV
jgi:hypothetical protein